MGKSTQYSSVTQPSRINHIISKESEVKMGSQFKVPFLPKRYRMERIEAASRDLFQAYKEMFESQMNYICLSTRTSLGSFENVDLEADSFWLKGKQILNEEAEQDDCEEMIYSCCDLD